MLKTYSRSTKPRELLGELPVEYESACRLCLEKDDVMINIFGDRDMIPIVLKIRTCITIEVTEDDKLPNLVCQNCLSQLDSFYTFKKRCLATNVKLKQYVALPPSQPSSSESKTVKEYIDLTLSEDGNADEIKNACTLTWEEKQGVHAPIFEFPVSLMNNEGYLPPKNQQGKKPPIAQMPVKFEYSQHSVNSGYVSEDSMEDFAGFEEQTECKSELKRKLKIIDTQEQKTLFPITRRRGRPKKITNPLQCRVCYKIMKSEKEVSDHMIEHAPKVKSCTICHKTFNNRSMLQRHLRVHTGERPFPCDICGKAFSQKEILLRHRVLHSGERPYACELCDKQYSLPEALKSHIRLRHSYTPGAPRYRCGRCNKEFCHASGLSRHQLRHTGVMFSCTICNKVFTDSSSVKRHVRIHPKARRSDNSLQYEIIKMELGEHSYSLASKTETVGTISPVPVDSLTSDSTSSSCRRCSKVFDSKNELKSHYKTVHKEKRYKFECDRCGKTFRFATGLGRHQLIHRAYDKEQNENKVKTNKKHVATDKTGGVRVKSLEEINVNKRKNKNEENIDNSIEEDKVKESDIEETKDSLSKEVIVDEEKSINHRETTVNSEMSCSKEESVLEETMDDSEDISITLETKNDVINNSDEISEKIVETMDDSVEISIVPAAVHETLVDSKEVDTALDKSKNRELSDDLLKENDIKPDEAKSEGKESVSSEGNIVKEENDSVEEIIIKEETKNLEKELFG